MSILDKQSYKKKITMKFSAAMLDKIIIALLNSLENRKFVGNVSRLFNSFIESSYLSDFEKEARVYLIRKISDSSLEKNIREKDTILSWIETDGKYSEKAIEILNALFQSTLSEQEMTSIDKSISNQLKYGYLEKNADQISDILENLTNDNYEDFDSIITEANDSLESIVKNLRESRESIDDLKKEVDLNNSGFVGVLDKIIQEERNPMGKIRSGIQAFNTMIDGGFSRGRAYVVCGVAKGWKSGFMLKMALDAKKYNMMETLDPSKKPVILYLTMENSIKETITRICANCFGNDFNIADYTPDQVSKMLNDAKVFTPEDPNSPELILMYRSCKSINTADLRGIIDDLNKEGKEVCFLVLDYLKRIRSVNPNKEVRLELGQITDELTSIAKDYNIPLLTGMQLNREAFRALETAPSFEAQIEAVDKMGVSNIGLRFSF